MYRRRLCEVALCLVTACGSFGEGSSSSSGDISPPGPDASPNETGTAGDAGEGGPFIDATTDSSDDLTLDVCDDFERPEVADPSRWTNAPPAEAASLIEISDVESVSGARSLSIELDPSASDGRRAYVERTFAAPAARLKVRMKVFVESIPTSGQIYIAEMVSATGNVFVALDAAGIFARANLNGGGTSGSIRSGSTLALGSWHEVSLEYRGASGVMVLQVAANGIAQTSVPSGLGAMAKIQIGSAFASAGSAAKFYIDDACLDRGI